MIPQGGTIQPDTEVVERLDQPSLTYRLNLEEGTLSGQIDGLEAIKQAVAKVLQTRRFEHLIYSSDYGHELYDVIGRDPLWAREQAGVGKAKAFPLWDGPGTVKVVLLDNEMRSPAPSIVEAVQKYIDPTMDGMGEGAAPVGSVVTVAGAVEVPVNIEVQVTLLDGAGLDGVQQAIEMGVRQYLKDLAMTDPLVRYNRIANVILDIPEVIDYEVLTINGGTESILIEPEAVAVLGTVTVR
ncbi:baseplate J/gp47 family protein [Paenibacillus lactis]|uniref:baseplate J/gp47 family protein n=1 Tax=Paenibacillus lactis TaxID=228574 RepID=UPI00369839E6